MNEAERVLLKKEAKETLEAFRMNVKKYRDTEQDKYRSAANQMKVRVYAVFRDCGYTPTAHAAGRAVDVVDNWSSNTIHYNGARHLYDAIDTALGIIDSDQFPLIPNLEPSAAAAVTTTPVTSPPASQWRNADRFLIHLTSIWLLVTAPFRILALLNRAHVGALWALLILALALAAGWGAWFFVAPSCPELYQKVSVTGLFFMGVVAVANAVITQIRR